ncbi:MAG: hypothetical protein R6V54_08850 [Desulfobacteraceae bacterium]
MKQYLIDGLRIEDHKKLETYLKGRFTASPLGNIYWIELDREILTPVQKEHTSCQPHIFALELEERFLACELLVRIKNSIKCDCMGYATARQRNWLMDKVDEMLAQLDIPV